MIAKWPDRVKSAGWNRAETKKGEHDFRWLDHDVDDALALGLDVCLETKLGARDGRVDFAAIAIGANLFANRILTP